MSIPSSGGAGMPRVSLDHTTPRIWAMRSRSVKYQWPFRCALKLVTSPRTQIGRNAPSRMSRAMEVSDETAIADDGSAPGTERSGSAKLKPRCGDDGGLTRDAALLTDVRRAGCC